MDNIFYYFDLLNDDIMEEIFIKLECNFNNLLLLSDRYKLLLTTFKNKIQYNPLRYLKFYGTHKIQTRSLLSKFDKEDDSFTVNEKSVNSTYIEENIIKHLDKPMVIFLHAYSDFNDDLVLIIKSRSKYLTYTKTFNAFLGTSHHYYNYDN